MTARGNLVEWSLSFILFFCINESICERASLSALYMYCNKIRKFYRTLSYFKASIGSVISGWQKKYLQGISIRLFPGCENAAGKLRQKR